VTELTSTNTYGRALLAVAGAPQPLSVWDYTPYTCGYAQDTIRATLDELACEGLTARVGGADGLPHFTLTPDGRAAAALLVDPARS
jgi:hypothetical protein